MIQLTQQVAPDRGPPMSAEGWVISITVILVALVVAWYVITKLRNMYYDTSPNTDEYLGTFQDLREKGVLREYEYRTLKRKMSAGQMATDEGNSTSLKKSPGKPAKKEPPVEFEAASEPDSDQPDTEE
jgi:hypothetical protein